MHYAYEIIGGFLIFGSSWVTEEMPKEKKKLLYAILAAAILVYVVFGVMVEWQSDRIQEADRLSMQGLKTGLDSANSELKTVKDQNKEIKGQNKSLLDYAQKNLTPTQVQNLLASFVSSSDLRQQVQDLVQHMVELGNDYNNIMGQIDLACGDGFQKPLPSTPGCVIKRTSEEKRLYRKQLDAYLPQAIALRDAMRARIVNPTPFDPRIFSPDSSEAYSVIQYLDDLSSRLEVH